MLGQRRRTGLSIFIAAMALLATLAAGAQAAGEETGTPSTPGETAAESPSGTAEPAPAPGSTGWSPVDTGTGASGDGGSSIRRGSSLGSGGSGHVASTDEGPSDTSSSAGVAEPEPTISTPPTLEEAGSTSQTERAPHPAVPPASEENLAALAVGTATAVAQPDPDRAGSVTAAAPVSAPPVTPLHDQPSSDSSAPLLLVALMLGFVLLYAGWRAGLHLWDRRAKRRLQEVRWSREADWEVVLRRIELTRTLGASGPNGERLKAGVGSDPRN
jgi:hypothetical protein